MGTETEGKTFGLKADLKELVEQYHTNHATVNNLLKGGVKLEDLDEVLELRDSLSEIRAEDDRIKLQDIVSADVMARAYRAVGGDIDVLGKLVEKAAYFSGERRDLYPGLHTGMLHHAVDLYEDGNLDLSEE